MIDKKICKRVGQVLLLKLSASVFCHNRNAGLVHVPDLGGLSGSEDRSGGDNSIQFINIGRVGDKSFKEWRQKIGEWKGG